MFNATTLNSAELDAVLALAYICQQSLAALNGRAYHESEELKRIMDSNAAQIAANNKSTKTALWFYMSDIYAQEQLAKRLKKGTTP